MINTFVLLISSLFRSYCDMIIIYVISHELFSKTTIN